MNHAWLDSLSEDWPSQPASASSINQLPPFKGSQNTPDSARRREFPSRIPRRTPNGKSSASRPDASICVLSERSANSNNISSQRLLCKLSQHNKSSQGGIIERSLSPPTGGSVLIRNGASLRVSGQRKADTPEWKRRLVQGNVGYGEQRDLFSSAAAGLQNMFNPRLGNGDGLTQLDSTMPSSPPLCHGDDIAAHLLIDADDDYDGPAIVTPSPSPRRHCNQAVYARLAVDENGPSAASSSAGHNATTSPNQQLPTKMAGPRESLAAPVDTQAVSRKSSGRSDTRHEGFSPILIGKRSDADGQVEFGPVEMPVEQLRQKLEVLRISQSLPGTRADGTHGDKPLYTRPLGSEFGVDSSDMLPEESLQASTPKQFATTRAPSLQRPRMQTAQSPLLPCAPYPSPEKQEGASRVAGSPLKLFGPYDTFTNQTLLRRISQVEERHVSPQDDDKQQRSGLFGGGHLEGYQFVDGYSCPSMQEREADDRRCSLFPVPPLRPAQDVPQGLVPTMKYDSLMSDAQRTPARQGQSLEGQSLEGQSLEGQSLEGQSPEGQNLEGQSLRERATPPRRGAESDGKRPRTSPCKDPTPKRRRILHPSDVAFGHEAQLVAAGSASRQMQLIMGKKRKDARPGDFGLADAKVLATRSILWPRSTASKSRPSRQHLGRASSGALNRQTWQGSESAETERKPSIRTQDFVDQAAQIMAMIRNQVKPSVNSSRASGANSQGADLDDSCQESTGEPFSRPPSRDGKAWSRAPWPQQDPELMSRLKQYQEQSDVGDVNSSSLRCMGLAMKVCSAGSSHVQDDMISDMANVRITSARPDHGHVSSPTKDFATASSGRSISRTFPTTSSRGSESRRTIMPQSVSHLIPDRVGSMFLDKQNNVWVKTREPKASWRAMEDSEEDPFASIPDLTVDLTKEMQNLKLATAQKEAAAPDNADTPQSPLSPSVAGQRGASRGYVTLSPREKPGPHMAAAARKELEKLEKLEEHAWCRHDMDKGMDKDGQATSRRRNLTISFSSPVASMMQSVAAEDLRLVQDDAAQDDDVNAVRASWRSSSHHCAPGSNYGSHGAACGRGVPFIPRPVSRIEERDEDSTIEIKPDYNGQVSLMGEQSMVNHKACGGRHASLSLLVKGQELSLKADESAMIGQNVGKLSLSPMSDFSVNNADQSFGFEVSYVMGPRHMATGNGSKRVLSMTIRELVDKLSEAEPFEPSWEDMAAVNLHDKHLSSLHMLDQFCGKLVTLDASANKLGHLEGIPSTVRELKVSCNLLTELTSWEHLMNLQYIDISGNDVKSLSALKNLVHLRSIRADDNQLRSLDGLDCHEGLLSLRARNNVIEELDFGQTTFVRLTELDVEGNRIREMRHLELLPELARLGVRANCLRELTLQTRVKSLRQLDVRDNELEWLDIGHLPNLRSLRADGNRISKLRGVERARRLDSLSLREQRGKTPLSLDFLTRAYEMRKLFLSGNYLGDFDAAVDFLNLQLLDVANCGLQRLPANMGQLMPNLRTLNINCNAIAHLEPLEYVPRLKKLLAAGNRLADGTAVLQLLMDFPHLTQLDVRDNPLTLGFYAPLRVLVPNGESQDAFVLPDADAERDGLFARRLDQATRLRRRLHQVALVASCTRLRKLDGLPIKRRDVLAQDEALDALVAQGLLSQEMVQAGGNATAQADGAMEGEQGDSFKESEATVIRGQRDKAC
ncbi:hypothetical protein CDD81_2907 [Ophiocordyceps australis]|uniref:Septation initiation network scaffold protein cdc11 n=1 Tax=Ophiocordyceps australis TaxID=1399860 RepID=A0A2C5XMS7_9HYPO|nr:hypothetical protein CDD81_2907 [Ophiocordyceps australis]